MSNYSKVQYYDTVLLLRFQLGKKSFCHLEYLNDVFMTPPGNITAIKYTENFVSQPTFFLIF